MQSIESKILEKVKRSKRGELIFPEDFYDVGSSEAIRTALHRLVKENSIRISCIPLINNKQLYICI